jgi:hypothetical protein
MLLLSYTRTGKCKNGFKGKYSHRNGIDRNNPPKLATEKGQLKDEFMGW